MYYKLARSWYQRNYPLCAKRGFALSEFFDMMPSALYRTVQYWDPSKGCKLTTVLEYFVKRECRDLLGLWKRNRENVISLDQKIGNSDDEGEGAKIADFVPDPESAIPFERSECFDLRRDLEMALADLPEKRRKVLQLIYFDGLSRKQAAKVMGLTVKQTHDLRALALEDLRKPKYRRLREYIDLY